MTTFEDSEKESEYGYVRKVNFSFSLDLHLFCSYPSYSLLLQIDEVVLLDPFMY